MENKGEQILQIVIFVLLTGLMGALFGEIEGSNLPKWAKWSTGVMLMAGLWLFFVKILFNPKD